MQTISRKPEKAPAPRPRRTHQHMTAASNSTAVVIGLLLFTLYLAFVQQMQGLDGDTIFLALYCACLSVFIYRAIIFAFWPHLQDEV